MAPRVRRPGGPLTGGPPKPVRHLLSGVAALGDSPEVSACGWRAVGARWARRLG